MTMRKKAFLALLALALLGLFAGVAAADMGYGVGDGTGPIGTQPRDGTGEQYQGPPPAVVDDEVVPPASDVPLSPDQAQLREREQLRLEEHRADGSCEPVCDGDQDRLQDQDQDRDRIRQHTGS